MEVSTHLQNLGVSRRSSDANIRKLCREAGISPRSGSLSAGELNLAVETAVNEVRFYGHFCQSLFTTCDSYAYVDHCSSFICFGHG